MPSQLDQNRLCETKTFSVKQNVCVYPKQSSKVCDKFKAESKLIIVESMRLIG